MPCGERPCLSNTEPTEHRSKPTHTIWVGVLTGLGLHRVEGRAGEEWSLRHTHPALLNYQLALAPQQGAAQKRMGASHGACLTWRMPHMAHASRASRARVWVQLYTYMHLHTRYALEGKGRGSTQSFWRGRLARTPWHGPKKKGACALHARAARHYTSAVHIRICACIARGTLGQRDGRGLICDAPPSLSVSR